MGHLAAVKLFWQKQLPKSSILNRFVPSSVLNIVDAMSNEHDVQSVI